MYPDTAHASNYLQADRIVRVMAAFIVNGECRQISQVAPFFILKLEQKRVWRRNG